MTTEDLGSMAAAGPVADGATDDRWLAASYRCSCGFASDGAGEFGRHLDAAEGAQPEHFEVLAGWTFQQVRQWLAAVTGPLLTAGWGEVAARGVPGSASRAW